MDQSSAGWLRRLSMGGFALLLFILSLLWLGVAVGGMHQGIRTYLEWAVDSDLSALGVGWLASSLLMNGSAVAAAAITLFDATFLTVSQLLMIVVGTRLGVSLFVVLLGGYEYVRDHNPSLPDACSFGALNFIVSAILYVPGAVLGMLVIRSQDLQTWGARFSPVSEYAPKGFLGPILQQLTAGIGTPWAIVLSIGLLLLSLNLLDRSFRGLEAGRLRRRFEAYAARPYTAFLLGALVTLFTASVSVSVGLIVPLYSRSLVSRRIGIPYLIGANVTTLSDTLLGAVVLGNPVASLCILLLMVSVFLPATLFMVFLPTYGRFIDRFLQDLIEHPARFFVALAIPGLVPVGLLFL